MKRTWRKVVSVFLALAMVFLALPEYVKPVETAKAEGEGASGSETILCPDGFHDE